MKICKSCNHIKELGEFHRDLGNADGRRSKCKLCHQEDNKLRNQVRTPEERKALTLKVDYNITLDQWNQMFNSQNGCCALCNKHQSVLKTTLAVDHDHSCCSGRKSCGKCVRGLLCGPCNRGLGCLQDSPDLCDQGATYLRRTKLRLVSNEG